MIDYRYHAISLVAVLIALTLGLLLGVTIGDAGLVSDFKGNVEESLSSDLKVARQQEAASGKELKKADDFLDAAFPQVVDGHLAGQRIALLGSSGSTRDVVNEVRRSVSEAGAKLIYVGELVRNPDLEAIGDAIGVNVGEVQGAQRLETSERLGRSVGRKVARGRASSGLRQLTFGRFSGVFARTRSDVYAHLPQRPGQAPISASDSKSAAAFERGFVRGLSSGRRRVVGVERSDTNPSSVRWYRALGLSTVDNVDRYAGKYALVLTLDGATGNYGYKKTADAVIPPVAP